MTTKKSSCGNTSNQPDLSRHSAKNSGSNQCYFLEDDLWEEGFIYSTRGVKASIGITIESGRRGI